MSITCRLQGVHTTGKNSDMIQTVAGVVFVVRGVRPSPHHCVVIDIPSVHNTHHLAPRFPTPPLAQDRTCQVYYTIKKIIATTIYMMSPQKLVHQKTSTVCVPLPRVILEINKYPYKKKIATSRSSLDLPRVLRCARSRPVPQHTTRPQYIVHTIVLNEKK